ncbi:MAG: molecular chaperone DnaJ [Gammaproteobacteria bacterium]
MIFRLILLILLPVAAYFMVKSARSRFNLTGRQTQILFLIVAALLMIGVLVVLGRLPVHFIFAPLGAAAAFLLRFLPMILRLLPFWQMFRSRTAGGQTRKGNQSSTIRTAYLLMELDHDSGNMDGEILQGQFAGRKLAQLELDQLLELRMECQSDTDSLQVLEAYLDRTRDEWRGQANNSQAPPAQEESTMTRQLALEILGLEEGASDEEIVKAHRSMMQRLHPDRGGSDYLAKKINTAKDFLLQ